MRSWDQPERTFPGMYNSHYMDAYAAYEPEKSDWDRLNPRANRMGFVPGSSLRNKPQFHVAGITAEEHARNSVNLTPANMSNKGWMPTEVMPVWDSKNQAWDRGLPKSYDFVTSTFGSQFVISHPDSPEDRYVRASAKIGGSSGYPKDDIQSLRRKAHTRGGSAPPGKNVTLTVLGDWNTTIDNRPMTSDDGFYRAVTSMKSTNYNRPSSAASMSEFGYKSKLSQTKDKTFLTKSLEMVQGLNVSPSTWAGIAIDDMVDPGASANDRTRFCRGADNIKQGVMTRPEKFSRYKTTNLRTNKTVEKVLKSGGPRKKGDPYYPIHVFGDHTKVSGDSPGWFGLDHVTVHTKSKGQEKMLQAWGGMRDEPHWLTTAEVGDLAARTHEMAIREKTMNNSWKATMSTKKPFTTSATKKSSPTRTTKTPSPMMTTKKSSPMLTTRAASPAFRTAAARTSLRDTKPHSLSEPQSKTLRGTTQRVNSPKRPKTPVYVYKHHYTADERKAARTARLSKEEMMKTLTGKSGLVTSSIARENDARADMRRITGNRFRPDQYNRHF